MLPTAHVRAKRGILFLYRLLSPILAVDLGAIKSPFDRLPAVLGSMFYVCLSPNIRLLGLVNDGGRQIGVKWGSFVTFYDLKMLHGSWKLMMESENPCSLKWLSLSIILRVVAETRRLFRSEGRPKFNWDLNWIFLPSLFDQDSPQISGLEKRCFFSRSAKWWAIPLALSCSGAWKNLVRTIN